MSFSLIQIFLFFFSSLLIISALLLINTKNPVYSVLFLILVFCNSTGLLLLFNIEFISILLIIIYIGAITVLFLFVIMMLNIQTYKNPNFNYLITFFLLSGMLLFVFEEIILFVNSSSNIFNIYNEWISLLDQITNIETVGQIIYTYYFPLFLTVGIILLLALIGAVLLTLTKTTEKHVFKQISRDCNNSIFSVKLYN